MGCKIEVLFTPAEFQALPQRELGPLINELHEFPAGTKDCLMALTFARRVYYDTPAKKTGAGMNVGSVRF